MRHSPALNSQQILNSRGFNNLHLFTAGIQKHNLLQHKAEAMKLQQTRRGFFFSEAATCPLHIFNFHASDKTDGSEAKFDFKSKVLKHFFNMLSEQRHSRDDNNNNNNKSKKKPKKTHNLCSPTCRLIGLSGSQDKLCRLLSLSSVNLLFSVCEPETESSARQHAAAVICLTTLVYTVGVRGLTGDAQKLLVPSVLRCSPQNLTT